MTNTLSFVLRNAPHPRSMLLDKTKLVKPRLINIGGRGWLVECDIEGVVGKVILVFKYSQPFLSKIVAIFERKKQIIATVFRCIFAK